MKILSPALALFCLIICFRSGESLPQGSWFSQTTPPISDVYAVAHVDNFDPQTAVAVDSLGRIPRTTSGGFRWSIQYLGGTPLHGLSFTMLGTGTVVGDQGIILRTTDGDDTWTPQYAAFTPLFRVSLVDVNNGIAVGDSGTILRATDCGDTWTAQLSGTNLHVIGSATCVERLSAPPERFGDPHTGVNSFE